jgi:hypothetical protein
LSIKATEAQIANAGRGAKLDALRLEEATIKLDQLKSDAKIPSAVKAKADMLREEIKTINKTIYDKEAQNSLTPEGQAALTDRVSKLTKEVGGLYEPYMPKGQPSGIDLNKFLPGNKSAETPGAAPKVGAVETAPATAGNAQRVEQLKTDIANYEKLPATSMSKQRFDELQRLRNALKQLEGK